MKYVNLLLLAFFAVGISMCTKAYMPIASPPEKVEDEKMILGNTVMPDILHYFDDWEEEAAANTIDAHQVAGLKGITRPLQIDCYLGTWCGDSRRGVPPFMQAIEAADNPNLTVRLIGVNRDKFDPEFTAPDKGIERVPTFLINEDGVEIGRMIEFPERENFVDDFLAIVNKAD